MYLCSGIDSMHLEDKIRGAVRKCGVQRLVASVRRSFLESRMMGKNEECRFLFLSFFLRSLKQTSLSLSLSFTV